MRISEVAYASGFNDPKYFSTLFKKFYGKTPKEYIVFEHMHLCAGRGLRGSQAAWWRGLDRAQE